MRSLLVGLIVAAAAPALADPCAVEIVRAPDDVREVVETWIRNEPHCTASLEVRIVPTDGGLYLIARDGTGRVHERVVPDAQSAGVLIASWAADDTMPAPTPIAPPIAPPLPTPTVAPPTLSPPALVAVEAPPTSVRVPGAALVVGGIVGADDAAGARVELELRRRGRFGFGVAGTLAHFGVGGIDEFDTRLVALAAYTVQRGRWSLRASLGAGLIATWSSYDTGYGPMSLGQQLSPMSEISVRLGVDLAPRWTAAVGPVFTMFDEHWEMPPTCGYCTTELHRVADLTLFGGIRRRL